MVQYYIRQCSGDGMLDVLIDIFLGLIQGLLAQGVDVDFKDGNGEAALHKAAMRGHINAVSILLSAGNYLRHFLKVACLTYYGKQHHTMSDYTML